MAITSKKPIQARESKNPDVRDAKTQLAQLKEEFEAKAKPLRIAIHEAKIKELSQ